MRTNRPRIKLHAAGWLISGGVTLVAFRMWHLHLREVELSGGWHRRDVGPLIGWEPAKAAATAAQAIAPVVCVQNRFSLDERSAAVHEFVRACGAQGIAFVPYFAIAGAGRESGAAG